MSFKVTVAEVIDANPILRAEDIISENSIHDVRLSLMSGIQNLAMHLQSLKF